MLTYNLTLIMWWGSKVNEPKAKWDETVDYYLKNAHARLLSMKREVLPGWKQQISSYEVMVPEGESRFGEVMAALIDKVYQNEEVDIVEMKDALWRGAEEESLANHIKREAIGEGPAPKAKYYAWSYVGDFYQMDDWLNEYLVEIYLGQTLLQNSTYGPTSNLEENR